MPEVNTNIDVKAEVQHSGSVAVPEAAAPQDGSASAAVTFATLERLSKLEAAVRQMAGANLADLEGAQAAFAAAAANLGE